MVRRIAELYREDKPREKLAAKGPAALKTDELIALIIGSGQKGHTVFELAAAIRKSLDEGIEKADLSAFRRIPGVGLAKGAQIVAALELGRRYLLPHDEKRRVSGPEDVVALCAEYRAKKQEHFITVTLDGANGVIGVRVTFIGTLNQSLVHPREVFAEAIGDRAASVIFVHNHPSGSVEPSADDLAVTKRLAEAGKMLGIEVLDHLIVTKEGFFSFRQNGRI